MGGGPVGPGHGDPGPCLLPPLGLRQVSPGDLVKKEERIYVCATEPYAYGEEDSLQEVFPPCHLFVGKEFLSSGSKFIQWTGTLKTDGDVLLFLRKYHKMAFGGYRSFTGDAPKSRYFWSSAKQVK